LTQDNINADEEETYMYVPSGNQTHDPSARDVVDRTHMLLSRSPIHMLSISDIGVGSDTISCNTGRHVLTDVFCNISDPMKMSLRYIDVGETGGWFARNRFDTASSGIC
jgi:hypothetical protein